MIHFFCQDQIKYPQKWKIWKIPLTRALRRDGNLRTNSLTSRIVNMLIKTPGIVRRFWVSSSKHLPQKVSHLLGISSLGYCGKSPWRGAGLGVHCEATSIPQRRCLHYCHTGNPTERPQQSTLQQLFLRHYCILLSGDVRECAPGELHATYSMCCRGWSSKTMADPGREAFYFFLFTSSIFN